MDTTLDPYNTYIRVSKPNIFNLDPNSVVLNYADLPKDEDDCDKGKTLADTFMDNNPNWQDNWFSPNTDEYINYYRTIGDALGISDERGVRAIGDYFLAPYLAPDWSTDPMPDLSEPEDP